MEEGLFISGFGPICHRVGPAIRNLGQRISIHTQHTLQAFLLCVFSILLVVPGRSGVNPPSNSMDPLVITLTCPNNVTIECGISTLPASTGSPIVVDPCDPTPNINYYDYPYTAPATGEEMRWVVLPAGTSGSCSSTTNCSTGTICLGLQYTPVVTGILTSYTTGFLANCVNGVNPLISNASCVMNDHSDLQDGCSEFGAILFNSSGNTSNNVFVQKYVPIILHQVCFQMTVGTSITIDEDVVTNLTASINPQEGGSYTGYPDYTSYTFDYDSYCSDPCPYPYTIYRRFVVTDDCNQISTCVQNIDIRDITPPTLTCPANVTIVYPASTLPASTGNATATDLCDATPLVTYTDSVPVLPCAPVNFIKRKWKVVDDCGNQSTCNQFITIQDAGTICGSVKNDFNQGIGGVQINLYADVNNNLTQDGPDTLVATTTTTAGTGAYCFTNIRPCNYSISETQPASYGNVSDFDATADPDGNDSADGPDNQIPVTLAQIENDADNNFIDIACASVVPTLPFDTICSGQSVVLQIPNLNIGATYSWNFGSGSTPGTGTGIGPHTVSYVTTTQNQSSGASVVLTITKAGCTTLVGQVTLIDVNARPNPTINASNAPLCYYTNRIFQPLATQIPGATYTWNFGVDAIPASISGYGPHNVYYTTSGTKTVKLVIKPNEPGEQCPDSSTLSFLVNNCPAQVLGYVLSNTNGPINNTTVKLFADNNPMDGAADNSIAVRNVTTSQTGLYVMAGVFPGNYVIVETQPSGWNSFNDLDASDDGDLVANTSPTDNIIPVTLLGNELDSMNNFIETAQPGTITGSVFADYNGDQFPNPGEGIPGVSLRLLSDNNANGVADNNSPVATTTSDANGDYIFSMIPLATYVLVEVNPTGYFKVKDYDPTSDGDIVANSNMNNDTIPLTLSPNESDANNYFLDLPNCPKIVTNTNNADYGSLRFSIDCANPGDTIRFHSSLVGSTIWLTSQKIDINKNLYIISTLSPRLTIGSTTLGLFSVLNNVTVEFEGLNLVGGNVSGQEGAVFENLGILKLNSMTMTRNPSFPPAVRLIRNQPNASLFLSGSCILNY